MLAEALRLAYTQDPHAAKHARGTDERSGNFVWAADEIQSRTHRRQPLPQLPKLGGEYDDTPRDFGRLARSHRTPVITRCSPRRR